MPADDSPLVDLSGKVAVVTGAARGQGAAEARLFVRLGANVVLADTDEDEGHRLAEDLGETTQFVSLDVTDADAWDRLVTGLVERLGRVDVLINNAGIYRREPLVDSGPAGIESTLAVNLLGPLLGMRAVAPAMTAPGGSIVNISSTAGVRGHPQAAAYSASKFGVRGATRSAALELAPRGIRVNCVCPGAVDTPMIDASAIDWSHLPIQRPGTADEVARLVAFLASDASSYCTGGEFIVDGGQTA